MNKAKLLQSLKHQLAGALIRDQHLYSEMETGISVTGEQWMHQYQSSTIEWGCWEVLGRHCWALMLTQGVQTRPGFTRS